MITRYAFLLLIALCACSVESAQGKNSYKVGVEDLDFYPLFTTSEHKGKPGFLIEVMDLFAASEGIEFEYIYLPISRFTLWYENDGIDFRLPDNAYWNNENEGLIFSRGLIAVNASTVVVQTSKNTPYQDLKNIGTMYGFTPSPHWTPLLKDKSVSFTYDNSPRMLLRLLQQGILNGLDINVTVAKHYAKELGFNPEEFVESNTAPVPSFDFMLSTKLHKDVITRFNTFLERDKTKIQKLVEAYNLKLSEQFH